MIHFDKFHAVIHFISSYHFSPSLKIDNIYIYKLDIHCYLEFLDRGRGFRYLLANSSSSSDSPLDSTFDFPSSLPLRSFARLPRHLSRPSARSFPPRRNHTSLRPTPSPKNKISRRPYFVLFTSLVHLLRLDLASPRSGSRRSKQG